MRGVYRGSNDPRRRSLCGGALPFSAWSMAEAAPLRCRELGVVHIVARRHSPGAGGCASWRSSGVDPLVIDGMVLVAALPQRASGASSASRAPGFAAGCFPRRRAVRPTHTPCSWRRVSRSPGQWVRLGLRRLALAPARRSRLCAGPSVGDSRRGRRRLSSPEAIRGASRTPPMRGARPRIQRPANAAALRGSSTAQRAVLGGSRAGAAPRGWSRQACSWTLVPGLFKSRSCSPACDWRVARRDRQPPGLMLLATGMSGRACMWPLGRRIHSFRRPHAQRVQPLCADAECRRCPPIEGAPPHFCKPRRARRDRE